MLCGAGAFDGLFSDGAGCGTPLGEPIQDTLFWDIQPAALEVRDRIEVHWWFNDSISMALIHAWQGTMDGISVSMESDVLVIEDWNWCAWVRRLDAVPRIDLFGVRAPEVQLESQADFTMGGPWVGGDLKVSSDEMAGDLDLWFQGDSLQLRLPNGIGHVSLFRVGRAGFPRSVRGLGIWEAS